MYSNKFILITITLYLTFSGYGQIYTRLNLLGYKPADTKQAIIFSNQTLPKKVEIKNTSGKPMAKLKVKKSMLTGYSDFKYYGTVDFSSINKAGTYVIDNTYSKDSFTIDHSIYHTVPDQLLIFMRQQRCGYNPFFKEYCHQADGKMVDGPNADTPFVDVSGGWHDAGDQLKYLITGSNATARMLLAYQLFPTLHSDQYNALGDVGKNGVPDVLDEAKWGLDWILKLHPTHDVLIHQVADDRDHVGWKRPSADPSNYSWGKNYYRAAYYATGRPQGLGKYKSQATGIANVAGRSAAALAIGYQVWKLQNYDSTYATKCLQSAIELYDMAKEKPGYQQGNSYSAPYRYNEDTWTDDMEWAATELYIATKEKKYLDDAIYYADLTGELSWIQKDTSAHYQYYPFMNIAHYRLFDHVDASVKNRLITYYENGIKQMIAQRASKNIYSVGVPFIWCSNNLMVDLCTHIYLFEKMSGNKKYHSYLASMRDWLFGKNPWGTSMFMNIPQNKDYPVDVHTSTWALTKTEVPGGLVDGPIYYKTYATQIGLKLTRKDPYEAFQNNYVVYHDDIADYVTNEPTMDGTACAILWMSMCTQ